MHLLINENQDVWCYCRGDDSGKMIQCESGDCKIVIIVSQNENLIDTKMKMGVSRL